MTVEREALEGFGAAAAPYERTRPGYPPRLVEWVAGQLGLGPGRTVVDLAAGTGKLTRLLLPTGARIVAVEPVDAMRAELAAAVPGVEAHAGTAEAMPLPDGSADAVTVAQAFHWFDGPQALDEIHRVLRPGGRLALLWNLWDVADPLQAALDRIVARVQVGYRFGHRTTAGHPTAAWRDAFATSDRFTLLGTLEVAQRQPLARDGLVDRVASISSVAVAAEGERAAVLEEVRALAADQPEQIELALVSEAGVWEARG